MTLQELQELPNYSEIAKYMTRFDELGEQLIYVSELITDNEEEDAEKFEYLSIIVLEKNNIANLIHGLINENNQLNIE